MSDDTEKQSEVETKKTDAERAKVRALREKSGLSEKFRKLKQLHAGGLVFEAKEFAKTLKQFEKYFTEEELELYMNAGGV